MVQTGSPKYLVYGLIDPRSGELRYVGQTAKSLTSRLAKHVYDARHGSKLRTYNWLRQILAAGLRPEVEVLETCESTEALNEAERHHIAYWRFLGCQLTNLTAGGDGTRGWRASTEARRRKSDATLAYFQAPAARRKTSEATKRAMSKPEVRDRSSEAQKRRFTDIAERAKMSRAKGGRSFKDQFGVVYQTLSEAAEVLGLSVGNVRFVLSRKRPHTKGFVFTYCGETHAIDG